MTRPPGHAGRHPVLLVLGDPFVGAETLSAPLRDLLAPDVRIVREHWELDFEQAVAVNRRIEEHGVGACPTQIAATPDDPDVVGVLTQFTPVNAEMVARWPRLRFVATMRSGTENIDGAAVDAAGAAVIDNAGRNANAVAEFAVAAMLAHQRKLAESHHRMRLGGWRADFDVDDYRELAECTVGLIGFGPVGSLVARRLSGFDCTVLVHDPYADLSGHPGVVACDLDELLRRSDVVSLHARLSPSSRGLLGARELDLLKPSAIVVNTARSQLLDADALAERVRDGRIAGAALDVFDVEPLPPDHPLRSLPQISLSPHLAGLTVQARTRAPRLIAQRILRRHPELAAETVKEPHRA